ncbi:MAG: formylmethanofuran dehydrogenase subunit C, partial [Methylovulum sp.]|nr:formylmethanofuran dehydrogenase subunit C [Methylovulum sp.]
MSALTLTLKYRPDQRVDMSPLVCQVLQDKEPAEIAAIELQSGKRKLRVDELFNLSGSDTHIIIIKNSFDKLDFIGKGLDGGTISVEGDAGAYLGLGMLSGEIKVTGSAGLYAGCEMKKGY